jgi:hypothetical protein
LDREVIDANGEPMIDGLTSMRSWHPPDSIYFKMSATCPSPQGDYYGIYAVFTNEEEIDELWFLVVDGLSSWQDYGHIVGTAQIPTGGTTVIDHVDCTHDDYWVYGVFDRENDTERLNAQWVRALPTTSPPLVQGPYTVPDCGACGPPFDNSPFQTSIAYSEYDGGVLAIPSRSVCTCGLCGALFRPNGTLIGSGDLGGIWGGSVWATDVEWNNAGQFVIGFVYRNDWFPSEEGPPSIQTILMEPDAPITAVNPCPGSDTGTCVLYQGGFYDSLENDIDIVYSPNDYNIYDRMIVQTNRWTVWIEQEGQLVNSGSNPLSVGPWADANRASCEIWSTSYSHRYRIGHTYGSKTTQLYTVHNQWRSYPYSASEVYSLNTYYRPDSCASSDGYQDAEIVLVSRSLLYLYGQEESLFFNIELQE